MLAAQIHHRCTSWTVVASTHIGKAMGDGLVEFYHRLARIEDCHQILVVVDMLIKMAHFIHVWVFSPYG